MKIKRLCGLVLFVLFLSAAGSYPDTCRAAETVTEKKDINIDINKEDKEVGLRRMEIIDKVLSQDMLDRKMAIINKIEADYNEKAYEIINSIIPPIFGNKVFTHIDVNFFSPEFEAQVDANQKIHLSFVLKKDGFDRWAKNYPSRQEALSALKNLLSTALSIPSGNISGVLID